MVREDIFPGTNLAVSTPHRDSADVPTWYPDGALFCAREVSSVREFHEIGTTIVRYIAKSIVWRHERFMARYPGKGEVKQRQKVPRMCTLGKGVRALETSRVLNFFLFFFHPRTNSCT